MVRITHYSDALCVWAYISEARVDELRRNFGDQVELEHRFMPVFGDVAGKMATQWADRGGLEGYAAHVQEVAGGFDHISVNPRVWLDCTPTSSLPAHLLLCALRLLEGDAAVESLLQSLRRAFFGDCADLSSKDVLFDIAEAASTDTSALRAAMDNGTAHAQLAADISAAQNGGIKASPTLVLNEGRQMLAGNVGYRVIEANIRELLETGGDQQSWC